MNFLLSSVILFLFYFVNSNHSLWTQNIIRRKFQTANRQSLNTLLDAKSKKSSNSKRSLDFDNDDGEIISGESIVVSDGPLASDDQLDQIVENLEVIQVKSSKSKTTTSKVQNSRAKSSGTPDSNKAESSSPSVTAAWKETVESDIKSIIASKGDISILKLVIIQNRIELTVSNGAHENENMTQLSAEDLSSIHRQLYNAFELKEEELAVVTRFEILVATPGVSDILRFDRDFVSFQGFKVTVLTSEEFNKALKHEGTLVGRCAEFVSISIKGRKLNIPRAIVTEVHLPKSKIEPTDEEMRKLSQ